MDTSSSIERAHERDLRTGETNGPASAGVTSELVTLGANGPRATLTTLCNSNGMKVRFLSRGGIILSILVPDRDGHLADVVLGYDDFAQYLDDRFYFGALVGRSANRIANGRFSLGSSEYALTRNDGAHHLHGGVKGFSHHDWTVTPFENATETGAELTFRSSDGDQGYPGTLQVRVKYTLTNSNEFLLEYRAETDQATLVNLTQHTYFNLTGCMACPVLDHVLTLNADRYTPVDDSLIPTGELRDVRNSAFDFRDAQPIGAHIDGSDAQVAIHGGYDHNFAIAEAIPGGTALIEAARLYEPSSGRLLTIRTTEPGIQMYTGNDLDVVQNGKGGAYVRYAGVALETQHFPDAPNHPGFPSTVLQPGQQYYSATSYLFAVVSARGT